MKWFEETTVWTGATQPNHVYLMDDSKSKMFAYLKFGQGNPETFKKPIRIDTRGRKFKEMPKLADLFKKLSVREPEPQGRFWSVVGSKGDKYTVNEVPDGYTCSCSGWKFRGDCKHVKHVKETA